MGAEASLGRRAGDGGQVAGRDGAGLLALPVADHAAAPQRRGGVARPGPAPAAARRRWPRDRLQRLEDGSGPLFRRRYRVRIEGSRLDARGADGPVLLREPNRAAPIEVAVFRKTTGGDGPLRVGDEFVVRMPGPWDGPVVVVDRTPTSFRFATLEGHLEAGQIEFRAGADGDGVRFEIESWARSGDRLAGPAVRPGQAGQGDAAAHVDATSASGRPSWPAGRIRGGIHIDTRRVELEGAVAADRLPRGRRPARALDGAGRQGASTSTPTRPSHFTTANGWHVDDYAQPLPPEPPGPPAPGGQLRGRPAADARLRVRRPGHRPGRLRRGQPLRDPRHAARGPLLRPPVPLRRPGRRAGRRASWPSTAARCGAGAGTTAPSRGTWRRGQMDYEVRKWLDTGEVEFRIHAFSRPAHIPNPVDPARLPGVRPPGPAPLRQARLPADGPADGRPGGGQGGRRGPSGHKSISWRFSPNPLCRNDFGHPEVIAQLRGRV